MVAIVSGNSLGLDLTSLRTLGPQEFTGAAANGRNGEGVYVNVANGNLVVQGQDAFVTSVGADVAALRTYNSQGLLNDDNGVAGDNWSNGYFLQPLKVTGTPGAVGSTVQLTGRDGAVSMFTRDAPNHYVTTDGDGADDTVTLDTAGALYTWTDGTTGAWRKYDASNSFRLVSSGEPAGKVLTYSYDGTTAQLLSVLNSDGEGTRYRYFGGRLTELLTVKGTVEVSRVTYEYNTGRLSKVTVDLSPGVAVADAADVYWTEYGYEGDSKRVNSIRQTDGTQLTFKYDPVNGVLRISSVTNALDEQTTFDYALDGSRTTVTDPLGRNTVYEIDTQGRLTRITAPASGGVTPTRSFHYDGQGNVDIETDGAGRVVTHVYDEYGNAKLQIDSAGGRVERQFDKWNQLTVETIYLKADPDIADTGQAAEPVSSRQIWSASVRGQLRFEVSAEGRVTQHQYDGSGQRTATIEYLGARYPVGATLTLSDLESWALGSVKADTRRIKLDYDGRGNLQTRTTFGQVDANGAGVESTQSIETLVWDQRGLLLKTISPGGDVNLYTHDGLGRVETATNALGQTSVTEYLDSQQKVVHTFPKDPAGSGLVSTSFYDLAGRHISTVQSDGRLDDVPKTSYDYDAAGRLRMVTDTTGRKQWILYTDAGYKAAEIDGNGTMKEYGYDASGRVAWTKLYDNPVDVALHDPRTTALNEVRPTNIAAAHRTWHTYDAAGRLVRTMSSVGSGDEAAVTEWTYDGASRLVREVRYAATVPVAAEGFTSVPVPAGSEDDRITRHFHDRDGLLRGTLDAEGYLTELRYDNAGLLTQRIAYARETPVAQRKSGDLTDLIPIEHPKDIQSDYFHDAHGRRVGELDGERYLTEHRYDANGRLSETLRYATSVGAGVTTLNAALGLAGAARTEAALAYDALGRLASQTNAEGTVTLYRYDVAGNVTATIRAAGTDEARSNLARYDLLGRVTAELSPAHAALIHDSMTPSAVDAIWDAHATEHTYDAAGRRKSTTNSLDHRTLFYYDEDGALRFTVDAIGQVRERVYDGRGRLEKEIERVGRISTIDLTGGEITQVLLARIAAALHDDDATVIYKYTRDGLVATQISATGNPTTFKRNAFGEVTLRTHDMGGLRPDRLEEYGYDRRGLLVQTIRDPGGTVDAINAVQKVEHDAFGRVTSTVDALGQARTRIHDRLGRVVTTFDAAGARRETSYDAFSRTLTQTDAMGAITTFSYNVLARSVTVTTQEGVSSTVFSTRHGEESRRINGLGQEAGFTYNSDGRLVVTKTPVATHATAYDALGRTSSTTDPNGNVVTYTYDALDRVKTRTVVIPSDDPALPQTNLVTKYAYAGREVRVTDPAGVVTLTAYDKKGRVATQVVDENGLKLTTTYSYNPADQVLTVTNPMGTVTLYGYDELGRRKSEIVDHGGLNLQRSWTYDKAGNVLTSTDPGGNVTRYAYDAEGRVEFTVDPLQAVTKRGYDKNGNLVSQVQFATPLPVGTAFANVPASGADRKSYWAYDKDNRLVFEVDALRGLTERVYDDAGNVVRRTSYATPIESVPGVGLTTTEGDIRDLIRASAVLDRTVRFAYATGGRLKYTLDATGALQETQYDAGGLLKKSVRYATKPAVGNGDHDAVALKSLVVTSNADQTELYAYDVVGRLIKTTDASGLSEITTYNDATSVKTFTNKKGDTWTYFHDAAGRLTKERSPVITLGSMGGADPMAVSSAEESVITLMTYDKVGNLTSRTEAAGRPEERTTAYGYDAVGRQVLVTLGSAQIYDAGNDPLATGAVTASERSETLQVRTVYDSMGNAVANVDVGGALSQKTYDAAGRVVYEVDAVGYVTGYQRNAFGEVTMLTRYATRTNLEVRTVTRANQAVTTSDVETALAAVGVDHTNDRTLTSTYDRAGRVTRVQEISADVFDPTAAAALQWRSARKTTDTSYNAFGEAVEVKSLRNVATSDGSVVTRFYDRNGREQASLDALGFVTERSYDAFGNLVSLKEYANAVAVGWSKDGYTRGAANANDRKTQYEYDQGNRKVLERRQAVEYSATADGTSVVGDLVTEYRYDAVGNQISVIDANSRFTRTYYDALGRVSAVLQPQSSIVTPEGGDEPVAVSPLTSFLRDAHGNVLRERRHANGATAGTAAGYTEGATSSADRVVRTRYDRLGRALQVTDARGHDQFFSYDAYGKVAKKWQPLEDGTGRVTYEVNTYDSLGQLVSVRRPGTTMQVQGGITARWITVPYQPEPSDAPPPGGQLALGWTELEGARVSVEVTYTTPVYFITTGELTTETQPTTTRYDARTVTVTKEQSATQAPAGMTVVFQDPVAKIGMIRVKELKGTTWETRWEGTYAQAQGTGVKEVDQSIVEETVATMRYNAFGEMVAHLPDGVTAEYFHYDAAGRLWRTNAGDGVDKIFLYDSLGNRTSEIRSPGDARGNVDLQLVDNAEEAHLDNRNRRTDFTYDAAGRLLQKTEAARREVQGGLSERQMVATSTVLATAPPFYVHDSESSGHYEQGTSSVKFTWTNLTVLGSGDVKVRVRYQTATSELGEGGAAVFDSQVFASHEAAQGITLSWTTTPITGITEITIWKKNSIGVWTEVIKQAPGTSTYQIHLDAASNRWAAEYLEYRVAGSTGDYIRPTLTDFGDRAVWASLVTLAAGTYEYRLGIAPQGQEERQFGSGTFTIAADRTVTVQTTDNTGSVWQRPAIYQKTDRWGNVVELSDARADWKTVYAYNANNQMVMQRLPTAGGIQAGSNAATRVHYDALGRQVAVRDALGYVNTTAYSATGNLTREEHADEGVVTHRYNAFGEKIATTDARGNVQSFTYDKGGNLTAVTKGAALVYDVDVNQQLLTPAAASAIRERWTYDALGRKLAHFNGENEKTSYRYDLLGNVIEVVQPMGQRTYAAFDAQGHKIAVVDANGYEATWRYDYFGKLLAHTDIGGAKYQYTYDNARQLLKQTNSREQLLSYKYDAAGQVIEIRDTQTGYPVKVTTYAYDLSGRRLVEKTVADGVVHQDNRLAYDAQGKLRDVADTRVRMQLAYDANGNRTSVSTTVRYAGLNGEVLHKTSRFFQYDAMNRQTLVDAVDADGTMDKATHRLKYDKNGNRISDAYRNFAVIRHPDAPAGVDAWTVREELGLVTETYAYDDLNRLTQIKRDETIIDNRGYDAADRVMTSGAYLSNAYLDQLQRLVTAGHAVRQDVRINRYDANGRMLHQSVKSGDGKPMQEVSWDPNWAPREVPASQADAYRAEGYDHAGNVKGYTVFTHEGSKTLRYSTTLDRFEGYVGTDGRVTESTSGETNTNKQVYDANGHLVRVDDNHLTGNERSFVNDAQGRALSTVRGGHVQRQLIVNGEVMGRYGVGVHERVPLDGSGYPNFTDVADFNFSFASVTPTHPAPSPGAYIAQAGDTLQTIARGAYGDGALWYLIAQANGLSSNDDVRVGQALNIPNRVGTVHNNEGTFKPYDPSKMTGDLAPSLPLPGAEGCGAAAQILILVVAIVVTIFTAGAAAAAMGAVTTTTTGCVAASASTLGATMTSGVAALSGASGGLGMVAAGIGAAVGSAASQGIAMALGMQDRFSWKAVGLSALSAGVTAGVGAYGAQSLELLRGMGATAVIGRAVVGNVASQGIGVALGLQPRFDWKGLAAAAVGAGVGHAVGGALGPQTVDGVVVQPAAFSELGAVGGVLRGTMAGMASGAAAALVRGGRVVMQQVAIDAFGNALGSSLAEAASSPNIPAPVSPQEKAEILGPFRDVPGAPPQVTVWDVGAARDKWAHAGERPAFDFSDNPYEVGGDQLTLGNGAGRIASKPKYGPGTRTVAESQQELERISEMIRETRGGVSRGVLYNDLATGGFREFDTGGQRNILAAMDSYASAWQLAGPPTSRETQAADVAMRTAVDWAKQAGTIPERAWYGSLSRQGLDSTQAMLGAAAVARLRQQQQQGPAPRVAENMAVAVLGVQPAAEAPAVSLKHVAWGSDVGEVSATMERLGIRALKQSNGNPQLSERLFETYLIGVSNRLASAGSEFGVEIQPAAIAGGERVPNFIYLHRGGPSSPLITGRDGEPRLFAYPDSRRLDAGLFNTTTTANEHGLRPIVSGFDITTSQSKPNIVRYYQEYFGNVPIYDIRLPRKGM